MTTAVGNDNYRPGMEPPEPMKRNSGWLYSNLAQLMVFLNGLILTITAFATLSVFIDEIVKEGLIKVNEDVKQYVIAGYQDTEHSLNILSTVILMSEENVIKNIENYIKRDRLGLSNLKEIYYLKSAQASPSEIISLQGDSAFLNSFKKPDDFRSFINLQVGAGNQPMYAITSLPNLQTKGETKEEGKVYDRLFAIIRPVRVSSEYSEYIVATVSMDSFIKVDWLQKNAAISDLQIIDTKGDLQIYAYQKSPEKAIKDSKYTNMFDTKMADRNFDVKLDLVINSRESFLQKIPLLMLLFGVTLTLIGTLYVRNNQTQSLKLSEMNKKLAYKNFELNQEMTERGRLSQVIQKTARENTAIINAVSDIIFELGVDGKILFLNNSWNNVTGFQQERSIGRNLFDLLYGPDQQEQRDNFDQLVKGQKKSYRVFTRLRSADGTFRAVELAMSMLRQDENKEMRVVGTITDVEERRRAERALSEAEKKYRTIVENAASGIYQVTPEGQFLSANPAFAKITGYATPEDVLREVKNAKKQLYVDYPGREKFLSEVIALDLPQSVETQITRQDGRVIWVSETVRPVRDDEGALLFFEGNMEDIDQRKKAEIALTDAKIESDLANRAKSEFLANMSHELRTPLNSIIGFSEIIKNESFGELAHKEYKEYADNIFESGNNLLRVINEILDVSRIAAGERTLNETIVNVKMVVKSCLDLMEGKMKAANMRIENKIKDSDLGFVGETQSVKQMLLNLMSNAIKFSPPGGFIMLDSEIDSQGRLRLSVTDTGIGMNESELEKALSPFGQIDNDHKRAKSGTGLGLTLVKSLVELHGGELEMVSQKGIGTTATLIFPAKRVTQRNSKKPNSSESQATMQTKDA
ncbi:MAG: PAS domain-containing sensor histidine kinase [Alphaproteobacteria bacterium]|nr:PAS domain-containing sensor histidine kinase [Alphaproteobacteria bacterium]